MSGPPLSVGIFIFPDVEVLDFAGPYEVFTTASRVHLMDDPDSEPPFSVVTIAAETGIVRARAGLTVTPDHSFASHPPIDLLIVPGGIVTPQLQAPAVIEWIQRVSPTASLATSVCNGAMILAQAGILDGKSATTHWADIAEMRAAFPQVTVVDHRLWVDEGSVVTSAGISAGLDMSLHLVSRLAGRDLALKTARRMEFDWTEAPELRPTLAERLPSGTVLPYSHSSS